MTPTLEARSIAVVINTGSRKGSAVPALVTQSLANVELPVSAVYTVPAGGDIGQVLKQAVNDGHDFLVVGGGDGTIASAAGIVAGTDVVLGVLPLGTANDLARTLEIPRDLGGACAALANGKVVDIDLGRANGRPFLNVASAGLSVAVTQTLNPRLKRLAGPLAYGVATVQSYAGHQPFHARLEFPEGDHKPAELENLLQVAVGNGRYYGGGNAVSPTAGIDDHTLDIYAIMAAPLREQLKIARSFKNGTFVAHPKVYHLTSRNVRLVTDPPLPVNLDGEIATSTPTDFTVERNAVHVVVPRHSSSATFEGRG
ncbi:YegS/Rv2252/BmrU family lipid kinase [Paenarthrobacter nitroguajacolicus]|uniref:lipid kinase n=1 Tax=Paenarthrobacter nitroguajacolicus TaxID=211146 RepID=UPI00286192BE|nr:lipid kinase [Paenarthrobacter nitroguajacolicus]MDR6985895.1 YegS/Rv2252/BmrU family lipid kinase [Paenarthrobacter nitroguajacolicus]